MSGASATGGTASVTVPRRRFLIVRNQTAGVRRQDLVARVAAALASEGAIVTIRNTGSPDDLREVAAEARDSADAVVAAGGDGTVRALATVLAGSDIPIGIIPAGTGNVMAREIGMMGSADNIARILRSGPVIDIEGARANGEPFFLMAGIGFDGAIVRALDSKTKQRVGRAAYAMPVLQALSRAPHELRVRIDGGPPIPATWAIATRASRYGGSFTLTRRTGLRMPGLVAVIFRSGSRLRLVRQILMLGLGRLEASHGVDIVPCTHMTVEAAPPAPVQLDGDVFHATPLRVEAGGARMALIVPAQYAVPV